MAVETGGPPVVCAGLTGALAARGHSVAVATLDEPALHPVALDPAIACHRFPSHDQRYGKSPALDRWLKDHIKDFDLLHLHSIWQFPTFAAARACWVARKPYVVLLNGMLDIYSVTHRSYLIKRMYWLWRERKVEGRAAGIHCLNRAEIRRAMPWISRMPKFVVGNAISSSDLASLPPRGQFRAKHPDLSPRPLFLFLSRLHPKKGLDRLIPAWKTVAETLPESRLLIAGTGDKAYVESLDQRIASHNMQTHIQRIGQLVGKDKWQALADADLFILPSHQEGFSMAITETLASGCPPIVTDECNFDELEPPAPAAPCGIIIRGGNMEQFAQSVIALYRNAARRATFAAAGRQLVSSRFTWENIAAEMEQVYRHILAGKRLPADGTDVWRT